MSTVTKIKGVIDNNSLPVITPEGLLPYWEGVFINRLAEQDYTLSSRQKVAIRTFLNAVAEEDCINDIRSLWPFIGNRENIKAAKVPLIGDKLFDFNDEAFTDIEYNTSDEIVGITSIPAIASLNTMDFCDEHCINIGSSIIKPVTVTTSSNQIVRPVVTRSGNDNYGIQYRAIQYAASSSIRTFGVHCNSDTAPDGGYFFSSMSTENIDDAGNLYTIFGFNDRTAQPYYNRMCNMNGVEKYAAALDYPNIYLPPTDQQAAFTIPAFTNDMNAIITGLVVFNKILTHSKIKIFTDAFKAMNFALGKEVIV